MSYYSELPYPVGLGQGWEIPVQWGPMGIPCGQTDMTENITSHNFVGIHIHIAYIAMINGTDKSNVINSSVSGTSSINVQIW